MAFPTWQAAGTLAASASAAVSPAWPTHQAGDIGLLLVEVLDANRAHLTANAAGWKEVPGSPVAARPTFGTGGSSSSLYVFWKRAASGAEAAPQVSFDSDHVAAAIVTIRGCASAGTPFTATSRKEEKSATNTIVIPGLTTTTSDQLIVAIGATGANNVSSNRFTGMTNASLANITERAELLSSVGGGSQIGIYTGERAVAGSIGSSTMTIPLGVQWEAIQIAFTAVEQPDDDTPWVSGIGLEASSSGAASVTPVWPPHLTDDIGLLFVESDTWPVVLGTPAGFAEIPNSPQQAGSSGAVGASSLNVYWCRATSAAMANPVVNEAGDHVNARIMTIRGCIATGNPWDVTAGNNNNGAAGTAISVPGATTTSARTLVVASVSNAIDTESDSVDSWANSGLEHLTERFDDGTALGRGGGLAAAVGRKPAAGSFGSTTATMQSSSHQGRISIALRPLSAGQRSLLGDAGAFTLTGKPATVARGRALLANHGAFVLTGQAASLGISFFYTINAEPGVFTLQGQAATIEKQFGRWRKQGPASDQVWRYQEPEE